MAKLYWRVKKEGKWTWTPALYHEHGENHFIVIRLEDENQTSLEDFGVEINES